MQSKLTCGWIITTNGLSQQTSKGVVVSTDGATMEEQFIKTFNHI